MPIVGRFFSQLEPEPSVSEATPHPLSYYFSHSAIVILGDPGSGKSTSFIHSAETELNAIFVPIRDFLSLQVDRWEGKTLYLDGLDEQRAKSEDGRGVLDRIREKLDSLKRPRYRLSCRAADWYGGSETQRLRTVSQDGEVIVLRLEPLSDTDIMTIAGDKLANPTDFLAQAELRGVDPLIRNPQTLELIIGEVRNGEWPATRADLFSKACRRLLQETNPEHEYARYTSLDKLLTAAGYLCAIHLCGATEGYALNPQNADEAFPFIGELRGDVDALNFAIRRRVFRADGSGRATPIHRTVAEYLSAYYFAQILRAGFPLKRLLSLLTGYDKGTLAELRGIYAWLACLYEEEAATLIHLDPLGLILYGDASILSLSGKQMLIDRLRDLSTTNPAFRSEDWSAKPFGALASPDMVPIFRKVLRDQTESPYLLSCILDAIEYGPPLPELGEDLLMIVRDHTRLEGTRIAAYEAFLHVRPTDKAVLKIILEEIKTGQLQDKNHQLRGHLLSTLYPSAIGANEIGQYLVRVSDHHSNIYTMFVAYDLVDRTTPQDLPLLFNGIDAKTQFVHSLDDHIWKEFFGHLILKILVHLGESTPPAQLSQWLDKVLDKHGRPISDHSEVKNIQEWLTSHSDVVKGLFEYWLAITPFKNSTIELNRFWMKLYSIAPPSGFSRYLLSLAESEFRSIRAEFLFREAVSITKHSRRRDDPTLDELFDFIDTNPRFSNFLESELISSIQPWQIEQDLERKARETQKIEETNNRIKQFYKQLESIRSGVALDPIVHLAHAYFGRLPHQDRDKTPNERLVDFTNQEITVAALNGFVAILNRTDIPTSEMIGEASAKGKHYLIGLPVLAGLDLIAEKSLAALSSLPKLTLQSGLAFHYSWATDQKREWIRHLIDSMPELTADALTAYWHAHLICDARHIAGLYEFVRADYMKPIARRIALLLLKKHPNVSEDNLEQLLHAALRNTDREELLSYAKDILARSSYLTDTNRTLWWTVAFIIDCDSSKNELAGHIGNKIDEAERVLNFLCPWHGARSETPYVLPAKALAWLIATMGPLFSQQDLSYLSVHGPRSSTDSIRSLIRLLGNDLTYEASLAFAELDKIPGLTSWHAEIAYATANQARQRREVVFKYPTVDQIIETLNQGRPANAPDLQALVLSHLEAISAHLRDGPTDGWKGMWNVDSHNKPTAPRHENDCRDRLLDFLRPQLLPIGVAPEKEGYYAEDKRADIKVIIAPINLPVEIKRHYHPDLWTAPRDQLRKLYTRDPGTAGRGIYLVFWFGLDFASLPKPPTETAEISTPAQLKTAIWDTLQSSEREALEIIVIDCSRPARPYPPASPNSGSGRRKRS